MSLIFNPRGQWKDNSGNIVSAGTLTIYANKTTSKISVFSDAGLSIQQSNSYELDASGRTRNDLFFKGTVSIQLSDSAGAQIRIDDDIQGSAVSSEIQAEDYTTFALAVTAAAGKELVISTNQVIDSNITLSGLTLRFVQGGNLDPNTGIVVTLNCNIVAGNFEIFDKTAAGTFAGRFTRYIISAAWFGLDPANTKTDNDLALTAMKTALPDGSAILIGTGNHNITQFQWPNKVWHVRGMSVGNTSALGTGTRITGDGTGTTVWGMTTTQAASGSSLGDIQIQCADATTDIAIQLGCADGNMHLENIFCNPKAGASPFTAGGTGLCVIDGNTNTFSNMTCYGSNFGVDVNPTGARKVYQNLFTNVVGASVGTTGTAFNIRGDSTSCDDLTAFNCTANGGNKALVISANVIRIKVMDFWEEATAGSSPVSLSDAGIDSTFINCKNWRSTATVTYGASANVINSNDAASETVYQFNRDVTVNRNLTVAGTMGVTGVSTMGSVVASNFVDFTSESSTPADPSLGVRVYSASGGGDLRGKFAGTSNNRIIAKDRAADTYTITGTPAGTVDVNVTTPNLTTTTEVLASLILTLQAEGVIA